MSAPLRCGGAPLGFCDDILDLQDPATDTTVFDAPCGGLPQSDFAGQIFAIRPDGSVTVELPGPFGSSAPLR
jgi:hypothetical protein